MRNAVLISTFGFLMLTGLSSIGMGQSREDWTITPVTGQLYRAKTASHSTVFVVTGEGIILSDPISPEFSQWLKSEFDRRFGLPVRYVLYSHSDADHASGGATFVNTAVFVGHENMRRGIPEGVHPPSVYYEDRHSVTLGGHTVEMIHPGPAHSDNMSVLRFPAEDALFVVDFISLRRLPYRDLQGYELELWLAEMRMVEAFGARIVVPGHGIVGTTEHVREFRHYVERLRNEVQAGMDAGRSLAEMEQDIQLREYRNWSAFEDWRRLNIRGMYRILGGN